MTNARTAQRAWENTWTSGPSDPLDIYYDMVPDMTISEIEEEIAMLSAALEERIPPRARRQAELALKFLQYYLKEREAALRTALEEEGKNYPSQFATPCPTELAIMAEYQEEKS